MICTVGVKTKIKALYHKLFPAFLLYLISPLKDDNAENYIVECGQYRIFTGKTLFKIYARLKSGHACFSCLATTSPFEYVFY